MAGVWMYIDKFKGEVLIDEDHPLAVAQRAKPEQESAPVADAEPEEPKPTPRKRR